MKCPGCGNEAGEYRGKPRKWCGDKCRRAAHSQMFRLGEVSFEKGLRMEDVEGKRKPVIVEHEELATAPPKKKRKKAPRKPHLVRASQLVNELRHHGIEVKSEQKAIDIALRFALEQFETAQPRFGNDSPMAIDRAMNIAMSILEKARETLNQEAP